VIPARDDAPSPHQKSQHDTEGFEAGRQTFRLEFGGSERGQALGGGVCRREETDIAGLHVAPFFKKMALGDREKP